MATDHDDDALCLAMAEELGDAFEVAALERGGRDGLVDDGALFLAHPPSSESCLAAVGVLVLAVLALRGLLAVLLVLATYFGE